MDNVLKFFIENWEKIFIVLLVVQNVIKGIRDAVDASPATDDNAFEKICTLTNKVLGYLLGFRAKKPV